MYQSFLEKYRPHNFKDSLYSDEIIDMINFLTELDELNVLCFGSGETGKTTILDIIIKNYYNVSKITNEINQNILRINDLSDQGVQYYRNEVKTFCQIKSSIIGKKKFIILDDIDYINEHSQQVFRNCIDKYKKNVNFIASTSNLQKIISSLQSRTTLLYVNQFNKLKIQNKIKYIIDNENLKLDNDAFKYVLNISYRSIKESLNILEKLKIMDINVNIDQIKRINTNINIDNLKEFTKMWLYDKNLKNAINIIFNISALGYSVMDILDNYFNFIKNSTEYNEEIKNKVIKVICKYIVYFNNISEDEIELLFFTNDLFIIN